MCTYLSTTRHLSICLCIEGRSSGPLQINNRNSRFFLAARPHPLCHLGINSNRILWEFLTYLVLFVVRINKYAKVK